jgi:hypothetical protein
MISPPTAATLSRNGRRRAIRRDSGWESAIHSFSIPVEHATSRLRSTHWAQRYSPISLEIGGVVYRGGGSAGRKKEMKSTWESRPNSEIVEVT